MAKRDKQPGAVIPRVAASRLSRYLRHLEELERNGETTTSSQALGAALGVTAAQVRKDLGYFGQFGYPGLGYKISQLIPEVRRILGTDKVWNVALVGVGNLGTALLRYKGFATHGFRIAALFDSNEKLVGRSAEGIPVRHIDAISRVVPEEAIELAILCVPGEAAQAVADRLVAAGIRGIFNFAPTVISVGEDLSYASIDLALELEQLSFAVTQREREVEP
jgi:redox-sensing transcriptional repressor